MNDSDTIQEAFADYYRSTGLAEETDSNKRHDLKAARRRRDHAGCALWGRRRQGAPPGSAGLPTGHEPRSVRVVESTCAEYSHASRLVAGRETGAPRRPHGAADGVYSRGGRHATLKRGCRACYTNENCVMTIAKRLIILLAVPLLAILGLGVLSRLQLSELATRSRYLAELQIPSLASLGNITRTFVNLRINVRDHLLATNPSERAKAQSEFAQNELRLTQLLSQYADTLISDEQDRRLLNDYRDQSRNWIDGAKQVMALAEEGRRDEAVARLYGSMGTLS